MKARRQSSASIVAAARQPRGTRWWLPRQSAALVLLVPSVMLAFVPQAGAHSTAMEAGPWYFACPFNAFGVRGYVTQGHNFHIIRTDTLAGCYNGYSTPRGVNYIHQYEQFYKEPYWGAPGTFCGSQENWNNVVTNSWAPYYGWDIWSAYNCNYGSGVNVTISIDSWMEAAYGSGWYGWGHPWRPATYHCHCP